MTGDTYYETRKVEVPRCYKCRRYIDFTYDGTKAAIVRIECRECGWEAGPDNMLFVFESENPESMFAHRRPGI